MKIKYSVALSIALFVLVLLSGLAISLYVQPESEAAGLEEKAPEHTVESASVEEGDESDGFYSYDKAFDIVLNSEETFEDMVVRFEDIVIRSDCEAGGSCQSAEISLKHSEGDVEIVTLTEGGVINAFGYRVKLSQIAPEENSNKIERRAVVLVASGKNADG
ncbi:MAG: hypothetical protein U5L75_00595 [Candidatus Campbellbacteria bacterium]|nr:hypothetical protein [Candidatus Campbellbacteria bacterium]